MANSNVYIDKYKNEFESALEHFKKDLQSLRTGRAQATIVENVPVEAYGVTTPLKQLASISIPESKSISIEPWDKNVIKDIEKALTYANLGLSVVNIGGKLIAKVPPMTEENRKELIKILGKKQEEAKIAIRQVRDKIREAIIEAQKKNDITEDDKYQYFADLDNYTIDYNKNIEKVSEEKEQDIMTI